MNDFMDITNWVGILVFVCGIYGVYATYQLKCKGVINSYILLSKDTMYKTCKDKDAYIREIFPAMATFAVCTTLSGAIDMIQSFVTDTGVVYYIALGCFIVTFFWFTITNKKLKDKYY